MLQFADMVLSSNVFDIIFFLLSSLVTGQSFMPISLLVLESSFIWDSPETYPHLSIAQYMEIEVSEGHQTWHECF